MIKPGMVVSFLRIRQWVKNLFVFAPLIFSGEMTRSGQMLSAGLAFFGFCFVASAAYIFNDYIDRVADRFHPQKSGRYFAAGHGSWQEAALGMSICLLVGLSECLYVGRGVFYTAMAYVWLNIVYTLVGKRLLILDVGMIAVGFLLRIWAGAFAVDVVPSVWLQICVFTLALFLGFTKRKGELAMLKDGAAGHRAVLAHYDTSFLDRLANLCALLAIVFFILYSITPSTVARFSGYAMAYSLIFIVYGMHRYIYLVDVKRASSDPAELFFQDRLFSASIVLWTAYCGWVLYTAG